MPESYFENQAQNLDRLRIGREALRRNIEAHEQKVTQDTQGLNGEDARLLQWQTKATNKT